MIRKLILALAGTAAIGVAALTPTTASAWGHGHWGHHGYGHGFGYYGPTYVAAPDCYIVKRVIDTLYGPSVRRVTVCD